VLVDWGARVDFYHSDLTRVLALGRVPARYGRLVRLVRQAQLAAIEIIRPGVRLADVDAAARQVIVKAGYGERFGHALGHGVGLEVHELPRVWGRSEDVCRPGMVFTVEPGVYIPGWGGVRIEDEQRGGRKTHEHHQPHGTQGPDRSDTSRRRQGRSPRCSRAGNHPSRGLFPISCPYVNAM
jgi:Xaa-Pro aminopeptidase